MAETQGFKARVEYEVTDGTQLLYTFPFSYLRKKFIKVDVLHADNSITTLTYGVDYVVNDLSLTLTNPAKVGEHLIIYRQTTTDKIITWNDGSILLASDMNTEDVQMLHLQEEQQDYIQAHSINTKTDSATKEVLWDALNHRVINVSDPKDPQDVVTKHYMENVQGGFVADNTKILNEAKATLSATQQTQSKAQSNETLSKAWATSTESPDNADDTQSSTGKTRSSRSWALYSKAKAQEAATSAGVFQDFKGATANTDGNGGKVPKPLAGQQEKFLKADGTWGDCVMPKTLKDGFYYYPVNYVPTDTSNSGWAKLGLCSIYYGDNKINNQPSKYGQLINLPIKGLDEIAQVWISQPDGRIFSRGGNTYHRLDETPFKAYATLDDVKAYASDIAHLIDALRTFRKRTYPTVFDDDELTVIAKGPFGNGAITLSQPYTDFDGLLLVCTDDDRNMYTRNYISSIEITRRKEESIKLNHPSFFLFDGKIYWAIRADSNFSPTYFPPADDNCTIECIYGVKFKDIT